MVKKFLLVITITDDVISSPEVVQKSVSGHFLKQYYLRCHHAKKRSKRKTWTIFHFFGSYPLHYNSIKDTPFYENVISPERKKTESNKNKSMESLATLSKLQFHENFSNMWISLKRRECFDLNHSVGSLLYFIWTELDF